jgi:DNA-binding response OmpR family regulator
MTKTVLVVEDDFDTLHPLAEMLRLRGFSAITASDAERALQIARTERPDLIITDIVLPGKSGLHFILSVRNDRLISSTPILVISGCGPMILVEAESAGADCCLEKPINIDSFWAAIEQIIGTSRAGEANKPAEASNDAAHGQVGEIDRLVQELRQCSSKEERENILTRLKSQILKTQARNTNCV